MRLKVHGEPLMELFELAYFLTIHGHLFVFLFLFGAISVGTRELLLQDQEVPGIKPCLQHAKAWSQNPLSSLWTLKNIA